MLVPIITCVIIGVTATVFVTGYSAQKIVIAEIENSTMIKLRDTVLISMTTMMSSGSIKESKTSFITQMKQTADLRVVRSSALDKDNGKGANEEYAQDQQEQEVIDKGVAKVSLEGTTLRGIYPYIAQGKAQGKNCLDCHN